MESPSIRKHRAKLRLSQQQLAEAVGTTQETIARIEAGSQLCRTDLASRLSTALGASVPTLFPGSTKLWSKLQSSGFLSGMDVVELGRHGIDGDTRAWTARMELRGGNHIDLPIGGPDFHRMFAALQRTGLEVYFEFDSAGRRTLVNLDHVMVCQFTFEASVYEEQAVEEDENTAQVILVDGRQLAFGVEYDDPAEGDSLGQFGHIFFTAELWDDTGDETFVAHFADEDGEDVFLRMADVAMLSVPVEVVEPAAMAEYEEDSPPPPSLESAPPAKRPRRGTVIQIKKK